MPIPPSGQASACVAELLRSRGAPLDVISFAQLSDALEAVVGSGVGFVVSCLPGVLVSYEGEVRSRFILARRST